jgi:hypothetical protein
MIHNRMQTIKILENNNLQYEGNCITTLRWIFWRYFVRMGDIWNCLRMVSGGGLGFSSLEVLGSSA